MSRLCSSTTLPKKTSKAKIVENKDALSSSFALSFSFAPLFVVCQRGEKKTPLPEYQKNTRAAHIVLARAVARAVAPAVARAVAPAVARAVAPAVARAVAPAVARAVAPAVARAVAPAAAAIGVTEHQKKRGGCSASSCQQAPACWSKTKTLSAPFLLLRAASAAK